MAPKTATTDYSKMFKDMMGAFPMDMTAMQESFRTAATYGEKFSRVALEAAEKSNEISSKWTRDTLAKMADLSRFKEEPADYTKALTDFASAEVEMMAETASAFAEVAKTVQMETGELRPRPTFLDIRLLLPVGVIPGRVPREPALFCCAAQARRNMTEALAPSCPCP
jgi:hypothetical protein